MGSAELTQPGQSTIIAGMNVERGQVCRICRSGVTSLRIVLAQLVVQPGKVFTRKLSFESLRDRCLHEADRPGSVTGDEFEIGDPTVSRIRGARRKRHVRRRQSAICDASFVVLAHVRVCVADDSEGRDVARSE